MGAVVQLLPHYLSDPELRELEAWAPNVGYRPVPAWLGNFEFKLFGRAYGKEHGVLPPEIRPIAERLMRLIPAQAWTTVFVQRYLTGQEVLPHRDPKNNTGYTVIAVFGDYDGAETTLEGSDVLPDGSLKFGSGADDDRFRLERGDVLILPCTINGVQGPKHAVSPVTRGIRYTLILNTIEEGR